MRIRYAASVVAVIALVATGACNGDDGGGSAADGAAGSPVRRSVYSLLDLGADRSVCISRSLPLEAASGKPDCRILLYGVSAGCVGSGLAAVSDADTAGVDEALKINALAVPQGSVCSVAFVSRASDAAGCGDDATVGWCYEEGACRGATAPAGSCRQSVCATPGFAHSTMSFAGAIIACP